MMRSVLRTLYIGIAGLAVSACGANDGDSKLASEVKKTSTSKSVSLAKVTLNGVTEELEVQPVMCGLNRKGDGFTVMAGPNDGDSNPRNNDPTLTASGSRTDMRNGSLTSIRYRSSTPGGDEENVIITGDNNPWIDGNRFQWSGKTQSGKTIEVDIICP